MFYSKQNFTFTRALEAGYARPTSLTTVLMTKLSHPLAFLALALWLLGNWLGAHGHFCFDGQEPPVSVHMHLLDSHPEHHADEQHQDADIELGQSVVAKLGKIDLGLVLCAALALIFLPLPGVVLGTTYQQVYPPLSLFWRPWLRAPPVTA